MFKLVKNQIKEVSYYMDKPIILTDQMALADMFSRGKEIKKANSTMPVMAGFLYEKMGDDGFGNPLLRKIGENTVVVGGAVTSLEHLCNVEANWKPKTLNEIYNIHPTETGDVGKDFIALFGVGTGGSGLEFGSVAEKDIKRRDVPDLIPLRANTVITGDEADKYYLQKENTDGTNYWYLKEFAQDIIIKTWWKDGADDEADGTEITSDIHESTRTEGIQSFAELVLDFNTSDVREYFESIGSLNSARYNSIGIYTGQKKVIGDREEYVNVRLFSYLNIDNKSVKIKTASQYIYRILALV